MDDTVPAPFTAVSCILPNQTDIQGDRRSSRRYVISLPVRIKVFKSDLIIKIATGKVLNMSSRGIAFSGDYIFDISAVVELSISWPVLLNGTTPVKLVIQGIVIRSDAMITAVQLIRY